MDKETLYRHVDKNDTREEECDPIPFFGEDYKS
jgi:hypothetical protein